MYERNCPLCNDVIYYTNSRSFKRAKKRKSKCMGPHTDGPTNKLKKCSGCRTDKDESFFWKQKRAPDGLRSKCKECITKDEATKLKMYTRNCPSCNKIITYKTERMYKQAERRKYNCEKYCHGPHSVCEKWCSGCQKYQIKANFGSNASRIDGLHDKCKQCSRIEGVKYINKDARRAYCRKNKNKINRRRRTRQNFHEQSRKYTRKRRELSLKTKEIYSSADEKITMKEFNNKCFKCGSKNKLCVDHHRPLSLGNALALDNAVVLCNSCNASKGAQKPEEFYGAELCKTLDVRLKTIKLKYQFLDTPGLTLSCLRFLLR